MDKFISEYSEKKAKVFAVLKNAISKTMDFISPESISPGKSLESLGATKTDVRKLKKYLSGVFGVCISCDEKTDWREDILHLVVEDFDSLISEEILDTLMTDEEKEEAAELMKQPDVVVVK